MNLTSRQALAVETPLQRRCCTKSLQLVPKTSFHTAHPTNALVNPDAAANRCLLFFCPQQDRRVDRLAVMPADRVEAKEIIVSFAVIQADDYDAAVAIARECPPGHTIEIRELSGYA